MLGINEYKDARSIISIGEKCINAKWRLGTTGTLQDTKLHQLQAESLFGTSYKPITTSELIKQGYATNIEIHSKILHYPKIIIKQANKLDYIKSVEFIEHAKNPRQKIIIDLALSTIHNTIILFSHIEHGTNLLRRIYLSFPGVWEWVEKFTSIYPEEDWLKYINEQQDVVIPRKIFYIDGSVKAEDRTDIRRILEENNNCLLLATYGVFSTGMNVKNLHNLILASPVKSQIRTLQSLGRILRLHDSKEKSILYDIVDEINYPYKHYQERLQYYINEKFYYTEEHIELEWK
jgi:hypothetical protein